MSLAKAPGGAPRVRLAQLAWGVGVGWYPQRTLELDLDEARQIARLLGQAPESVEQLLDAEAAHAAAGSSDEGPIELAAFRARRLRSGRLSSSRAPERAAAAPTPLFRPLSADTL